MKLFWFIILFLYTHSSFSQQIITDEDFQDWENVQSFNNEDNSDGTTIDILDFKITNDDQFLYLYFQFDDEILLQQNQNISILIDTDHNSSTGTRFLDIGYELLYNFGQRFGETHLGSFQYINSYDIGLVNAPTVSSDRFEIKLNLDYEANGSRLFNTDSIAVLLRTDASNYDIAPNTDESKTYRLIQEIFTAQNYSISKKNEDDIRVVSYNVLRDNIFDSSAEDDFRRIFQAIDPDIIGFQEIYDRTGAQTAAKIESFLPSSDDEQWYYGYVGNDNLIVSRYPVIREQSIDRNAAYLLDMGDYEMMVIVAHPPCCDNDSGRQSEIDQFMGFVRDSKNGEGFDLEENTPIIVLGDMNLVGLNRQVKTLIEGDIRNESQYGADFNPDWDGSPFTDSKPINPELPTTFTWYSSGSSFSAGRLDYLVYTASVLQLTNSYSLYTPALPTDTLNKYRLESDNTIHASDHLPLVADFTLKNSTSTKRVEQQSTPTNFSLTQNYPNPFNPITTINYQLNEPSKVSLVVFNTLGEVVVQLVEQQQQSAGDYQIQFDGSNLSSGIYFYRMHINGSVKTRKMVLLK